MFIHEIIEAIEEQPKIGKWIPCSEKLPENEKEVEITYSTKSYKTGKTICLTARAFYEDGTLSDDESCYNWNEYACKYDEESDSWIVPEGWYEGISFSEEFGKVDAEVIAWRELPEPYRNDSKNG